MAQPRHQNDSKTFEQLTPHEQAKSINASIVNLQRAIRHHVATSDTPEATRFKCLRQVNRLLGRLLDS